MSKYTRLIKESIDEGKLQELSLSTGIASILSKMAKLAGKDKAIVNDPEVKKAVSKWANATMEFRSAIEEYEEKYGPVDASIKKLAGI